MPRVAASGSRDIAKEQRKIEEYRNLVELVNAKVRAHLHPPVTSLISLYRSPKGSIP